MRQTPAGRPPCPYVRPKFRRSFAGTLQRRNSTARQFVASAPPPRAWLPSQPLIHPTTPAPTSVGDADGVNNSAGCTLATCNHYHDVTVFMEPCMHHSHAHCTLCLASARHWVPHHSVDWNTISPRAGATPAAPTSRTTSRCATACALHWTSCCRRRSAMTCQQACPAC